MTTRSLDSIVDIQVLVNPLAAARSSFNLKFIGDNDGILIFVLAPGAFITLGYIIALINSLSKKKS